MKTIKYIDIMLLIILLLLRIASLSALHVTVIDRQGESRLQRIPRLGDWPIRDWHSSSPEEQAMGSENLAAMSEFTQGKDTQDLHPSRGQVWEIPIGLDNLYQIKEK